MRVLIQNHATGLYLGEAQHWVQGLEGALEFASSLRAIDFCHEHGIAGVEIVLKFDRAQYDIRLGTLRQPMPTVF